MRVGIYGGTFDPIHNGHLHVIKKIIEENIVDLLLVIPAGEPRLRENAPVATGADRRAMCQLAINELSGSIRSKVQVNPIEILRMGPSYAIDTVEAVKQAYPDDEIVFIIGTDAFAKLDKWHRIDDLREMVKFEVISRPGYLSQNARDISALDISATEVRNHLSDQVPSSVASYIRENNLYAS